MKEIKFGKFFVVIFLFIFIMISTVELIAQEMEAYSGNTFYRVLKYESDFEKAEVIGLVKGYIAGMYYSYYGILWEPPKEFEVGQAIDIVKNYLEAHPEERHNHIQRLIIKALAEKLPAAENPAVGLKVFLYIAGRK